MRSAALQKQGKSVAVVGAGGNIGSHILEHIARMPEVTRVRLIDKDIYERRNLLSQSITPSDVGRAKAIAQARRLRAIRSDLCIEPIAKGVEELPMGTLHCDAIVACLDSLWSRQVVNAAAWRLGVPWIDGGVNTGHLLARAAVYTPGPDLPCLECAWDNDTYADLGRTYSCDGETSETPPTDAPSSLGAITAGLQAIELKKLLTEGHSELAGRQVVLELGHHNHYRSNLRRNPRCRFDHETWSLRPLDLDVCASLGKLFDRVRSEAGGRNDIALKVEGAKFGGGLVCIECGLTRTSLRLIRRNHKLKCVCGGKMVCPGALTRDFISGNSLSTRDLRRSLKSLGVQHGDVLTVEGVGRWVLGLGQHPSPNT